MSTATTATLAASIGWSQVDTVSDNSTVSDLGDISYSYALADGTGISGEINQLWHVYESFTGNEKKSYDLTNLSSSYLGIDGSTSFSDGNVKSLIINNLSEVSGESILVDASISNGLAELFSPSSSEMSYVYPQGSLVFNNPLFGYSVDATHKAVDITNQSTGNFSVEIGIVGQSG